jgi:hypothetical protein
MRFQRAGYCLGKCDCEFRYWAPIFVSNVAPLLMGVHTLKSHRQIGDVRAVLRVWVEGYLRFKEYVEHGHSVFEGQIHVSRLHKPPMKARRDDWVELCYSVFGPQRRRWSRKR